MTAISYIRKEGGSHSLELLKVARRIMIHWHEMNVRVLPVFIPMEENIHADTASRQGILQDWNLHPDVFCRIFRRFGLPQINFSHWQSLVNSAGSSHGAATMEQKPSMLSARGGTFIWCSCFYQSLSFVE